MKKTKLDFALGQHKVSLIVFLTHLFQKFPHPHQPHHHHRPEVTPYEGVRKDLIKCSNIVYHLPPTGKPHENKMVFCLMDTMVDNSEI